MKKLVTILFLSLVLAFSMFAFVGCKKDEQPSTEEPPRQEQPGNEDEKPAEHTHDLATATKGKTVDPTCTEKGYTEYTCSCGEILKSDEVEALKHSFTDYKSNNDATTEKDGTKTAKCDRCDVTDTVTDEGTRITVTSPADFDFVAEGDGVAVKAYKGAVTEVTIPLEVEGKKVVAIADEAFKGNTSITKVVVTNNITKIGKDAFAGCTALTSVEFKAGANWFGIAGVLNLSDAAVNATTLKAGGEIFSTTDLVYVYDAQVADGKIYLYTANGRKEGAALTYGGATVPSEVENGKVMTGINSTMVGTKEATYTSKDDVTYKATVTINPITDNYYNVSASGSYKLKLANIGSAKFNGQDISEVAGITLDETGLTFTRATFAGKEGHNKLEIVSFNKTYVLSICAVTQSQLDNPITFEDGQVSPFIGVIGSGATAVVDMTDKSTWGYQDGTDYSQDASSAKKRYYINADKTETLNKMWLGVFTGNRVYISTYYIKARVAQIVIEKKAINPAWELTDNMSLVGKGLRFNGESRQLSWMLPDGTSTVSDPKYTFSFLAWDNAGPNYTPIMNKATYDKILADDSITYIYSTEIGQTSTYWDRPHYFDDLFANFDVSNGGALGQFHSGNVAKASNDPLGAWPVNPNGGAEYRAEMAKVQLA